MRILGRRLALGWLLAVGLVWAEDDNQTVQVIEDRWDVAYVGSEKIGYFHTLIRQVETSGRPVVHTRQHSKLTIQRFGQEMNMESLADSYELPNGLMYATDAQTRISKEVTRTQGRLKNTGRFEVTVTHKGSNVTQELDWPADLKGPYAQEKSLREQPLAAGDSREFVTFLAELNVIARRTLTADERETVTLPTGESEELLRVKETSDKVALESLLWLNDKGEAIKMTLPLAGIELTTVRSTKAAALESAEPATMDFGLDTLVRPDRAIPRVHTASSATYRLEFDDQPAADTLPTSIHQQILAREERVLHVKERRITPKGGGEEPTSPPEGFLGTNTYIQPSHPKIQLIAREVTAEAEKPWDKALKLEEWVSENMTNMNFTIGFAPASEVIETREGDCTEHAVLLAALCRAVGVPSRVAMGLVYLESSQAFGYHMWTEVWVDGEWYDIDGTMGYGGIGAGHIKIADGSLDGVDANSTFLPIFQVIGKLKIFVEDLDTT